MGAWMNWQGALLILCLAPLGLVVAAGAVLFVLRIVAIVQKAGEPPTVDEDGHYELDQGRDIGRDD